MRSRLFGAIVGLLLGFGAAVFAQSWTAPRTWVAGELVTPSLMNVHVRDNLTVLRAGGIAIASQAANDLIYASSATQFARLATGTGVLVASGAAPSWSTTPTLTGTNFTGIPEGGITDGAILARVADAETISGQWAFTNAVVGFGSSDGFIRTDGTAIFTFQAGTNGYLWRNNGNSASLLTLSNVGALQAPSQPGFLAYNSVDDAGTANGSTVDFDTEVYDEAGNFSADTFTAPVTGRYLLCAGASLAPSVSMVTVGIQIVTSNRTYTPFVHREGGGSTEIQIGSGCVIADMDAADTAIVRTLTGGNVTVGGAAELYTYFSGRLVP